ncbi:MAG TPA: hypothetical protein VL588_02445, partial [Bdellovibrionota bacterium]|nr:hypothetical protein [Bdellovibrionota bacterium]
MRRWLRPGIAVAVVCAVSAAAWLGAQPVLTAALKRQLPQIQAAATAAIGSDVRLGEIDVHLAWPVPELRVSSVEIRDPEDQSVVLAIGRVSARL